MNPQQKSYRTSMLAALLGFFGAGRRRSLPKRILTGNRALPIELQSQIIAAAEAKRQRKNDRRKAEHFNQKKLGHYNFKGE